MKEQRSTSTQSSQKKSYSGNKDREAFFRPRVGFGNVGVVQRNKSSFFKPVQKSASQTETKNNTGLPDKLKAGVENLSGYSMDDVKVHYNSDKPAEIQAHAYAQGTDIHLASGQEKHLPHEAWHVVQQKEGRVKPTQQLNGFAMNNDKSMEKEADNMGSKAIQMGQANQDTIYRKPFQQLKMTLSSSSSIVSRMPLNTAGGIDGLFSESSSEEEIHAHMKNASPDELKSIASNPEVADELEKLQSDPEIAPQLPGKAQQPVSEAAYDEEHRKIEFPTPEEEAKTHGFTLEEAREKGIIQRQPLQQPVQRVKRAAAIAARYLISTMVSGSSHGFAPVRRNHTYPQQNIGGDDYQYSTSAEGSIDFKNNEVPNGQNPVVDTQNIQAYFNAHGWSLKNLTRYYHFKAANALRAGFLATSNAMPPNGGSSPAGLTWHHDEDVGRMDLTDRAVHAGFRHRGGFSIWGS